jgi:hypothetical protein
MRPESALLINRLSLSPRFLNAGLAGLANQFGMGIL